MAFWSSEAVRERQSQDSILTPFNSSQIKHGAYEMTIGSETFITSGKDAVKRNLAENEQLLIPPGQFALLMTDQKVKVPANAIAFISIKAGIKLRGLVNVSGFHIDPGFEGRLKFSVFNAGSHNIVLERGQRMFLVWFADLDRTTEDLYGGKHKLQDGLAPADVNQLQGEVASPNALKRELKGLAEQIRDVNSRIKLLFALFGGLFVAVVSSVLLMKL